MTATPFSKPKIAILAACLYIAVMAIGMVYLKAVQGITYGQPEMMNLFWFVLLLCNVLNVFFVVRYFSWESVGFGTLYSRQLLWLVPPLAVLIGMWTVVLTGLASASLSATQWQLLAIAGFTTFLVGCGEEVMFRGIVLHAFLTTQRVLWALGVSAIAFSLLHAINVFGGVQLAFIPIQLISTFLFGCLFAPLALKLNNLWPLILFHWLWDFVLFAAPIVGEQVQRQVGMISFVPIILIELLLGIPLWLSLRKEQHAVTERVKTPS